MTELGRPELTALDVLTAQVSYFTYPARQPAAYHSEPIRPRATLIMPLLWKLAVEPADRTHQLFESSNEIAPASDRMVLINELSIVNSYIMLFG